MDTKCGGLKCLSYRIVTAAQLTRATRSNKERDKKRTMIANLLLHINEVLN